MRPKMLEELRRFNNRLQKVSWGNYQLFLGKLLSTIDIPQARTLSDLLEAKDWHGLVEYADCLSSTEYKTAHEHRVCNQLASIIRKYPFPEGLLKFDPKGEAMKTFLRAEHYCKRMNQRFRAYDFVRSPYESSLNRARSYIQYVLGVSPSDTIWDDCRFGAGASLGIHGNATNLARKLLCKNWSVSTGAYSIARSVLKKDLHVFEHLTVNADGPFFSVDPELFNQKFGLRADITDYNKIAFVPKTVKVHRTIAVEPLLNGYLQKGVDTFMRKRLKRVDVDLSDQLSNQTLARKGSYEWLDDDAFCTIDLSSASDSISIGLCRNLLPPDWFYLLDQLRSHSYKLDGVVRPYHKFVSMGNGFCFPLESLIFASLCTSVYGQLGLTPDFRVYGDDLIVRRSVFKPLIQLLRICGFRVNPKKTFERGPFRESCGADWFEGEDVRPIILDYRFDSLENIFKFCNLCRSKDSIAAIFYGSLDFLESLIPHSLMFTRPCKGNVDTALEVPWDSFMSSPYSRYSRKTFSWSWIEIVKGAEPDDLVRRFAGYNVALIMGALTGAKASNPFTERYKARTKLRRINPSMGWSLFLPVQALSRSW